jgi:tetraprenyl-beta-curcumene synthase
VRAGSTRLGGARGHEEPAAAPGGVAGPSRWSPPARPSARPSAAPALAASRLREQVVLTAVFAAAARRYWLSVYPCVCRELSGRRTRAGRIGDPALQRLALEALKKRGNVEGAAAFAAFVPRAQRRAAIRALAAFQLAYDYVDLLAEQPSRDPVANARGLHSALLVALEPGAPHPDYYEHHARREDGGYLEEIVDSCREALVELPSHAAVSATAERAAARIAAFQSLSMGEHEALRRCATEQTPPGSGLRWWETAAAGGSSLGVLALIAAAVEPALDPLQTAAIEGAYFPWIGACHSLLDSLVDREEDARIGQLSLVGCYATDEDAALRMGWIAAQSMRHAHALPRGRGHAVLFAGMAGYYLSAPEAATPSLLPVCRDVEEALGSLARPTLAVFNLRRRLSRSERKRRRTASRTPRLAWPGGLRVG